MPAGFQPFWLPVVLDTVALEHRGCAQHPSQTFQTTVPKGQQWDTSGFGDFFNYFFLPAIWLGQALSCLQAPRAALPAEGVGRGCPQHPAGPRLHYLSGARDELLEGLIYSSPGSSPES